MNLQTILYNYRQNFERNYIDEDGLPKGLYRGPDNKLYKEEKIKEEFYNNVIEELDEFMINELGYDLPYKLK